MKVKRTEKRIKKGGTGRRKRTDVKKEDHEKEKGGGRRRRKKRRCRYKWKRRRGRGRNRRHITPPTTSNLPGRHKPDARPFLLPRCFTFL